MTSRGPFPPKTFYDSMILCLQLGISGAATGKNNLMGLVLIYMKVPAHQSGNAGSWCDIKRCVGVNDN